MTKFTANPSNKVLISSDFFLATLMPPKVNKIACAIETFRVLVSGWGPFCLFHPPPQQVQATILDILTPDDIRMLTETVDENSRRGDFQRVFPSPASHPYQAFFEQPRYYNLLLQAWCCKYPLTETRGQQKAQHGHFFCTSFCKVGWLGFIPRSYWTPISKWNSIRSWVF